MPELGGCLFSAAVHAYFTNRLLRAVHAHLPVRQSDFSRRSRDTDLRETVARFRRRVILVITASGMQMPRS